MNDIRSLVDRNADACERAKTRRRRCRCHCGGALHGKKHGKVWRMHVVAKIEEAHGQQRAFELAQFALAFQGKRDDDAEPGPDYVDQDKESD